MGALGFLGRKKYRRENRINNTVNSENSKNRRICKNSRNNLTCDLSNATRGPSLNMQFKSEHLQPISLKSNEIKLISGPLANQFMRVASPLASHLMIGFGVAADKLGQFKINMTDQSLQNQRHHREAAQNQRPPREAALNDELMSWPHANLEALPNKTHVSTRTKHNQLNFSRPSLTWLFQGLSSNKLAHMLNGNRGRSYDIGMWNCRNCLLYTSPSPRDS